MWTWAVVSNAISPAFSPPQVPSIGPWKRGPPMLQSRTRIRGRRYGGTLMNKVILAGLALILVRDCNIGGPRFHGPIEGTWGGENAGLIAFDTTAHVHIGCTAGDTKQAIVADEQGRFDAPGRYNITLYPVARGPDHPARFSGSTDGHVMTLTVTLTDTAVTLGPVQLELGREPRMGPCPICRRPSGSRPR